MIDQLVDCSSTNFHSTFFIAPENILVCNNELSEAGLIENIAQTVAAGAGYMAKKNSEQVSIGYIGAVKNLEIFALPKVGDTINTGVAITNQVFGVTIVTGNVECNGINLAKCEMKIFIQPQ